MQMYYDIIYRQYGGKKGAETCSKRVCAYNVSDAMVQAKSLQYMRPDINVLYVLTPHDRTVWL